MVGGVDDSWPVRAGKHICCRQRPECAQHCRLCSQSHLQDTTTSLLIHHLQNLSCTVLRNHAIW